MKWSQKLIEGIKFDFKSLRVKSITSHYTKLKTTGATTFSSDVLQTEFPSRVSLFMWKTILVKVFNTRKF